MNVLDKSHYFRGVLLLMRKDFKVSPEEKKFVFKLGKTLGFDREFVDDSIKDILYNEFIDEKPPKFTDPKIAECFIKDGMRLIVSDHAIDPNEMKFLEKTAQANSLNKDWFETVINTEKNNVYNDELDLEIKSFIE